MNWQGSWNIRRSGTVEFYYRAGTARIDACGDGTHGRFLTVHKVDEAGSPSFDGRSTFIMEVKVEEIIGDRGFGFPWEQNRRIL